MITLKKCLEVAFLFSAFFLPHALRIELKDDDAFACLNCTSVYDETIDGTRCNCLNIYDLSIPNFSRAMVSSLYLGAPGEQLSAALANVTSFAAQIAYMDCIWMVRDLIDCKFAMPDVQSADSEYGIADLNWAYENCSGAVILEQGDIINKIQCQCEFTYNYTAFVTTGKKKYVNKSVSWLDCHRSAKCDCGSLANKTGVSSTTTTRPRNGSVVYDAHQVGVGILCAWVLWLIRLLL